VVYLPNGLIVYHNIDLASACGGERQSKMRLALRGIRQLEGDCPGCSASLRGRCIVGGRFCCGVRGMRHLLEEPVPTLADPFPDTDPLPGAYRLHLPSDSLTIWYTVTESPDGKVVIVVQYFKADT